VRLNKGSVTNILVELGNWREKRIYLIFNCIRLGLLTSGFSTKPFYLITPKMFNCCCGNSAAATTQNKNPGLFYRLHHSRLTSFETIPFLYPPLFADENLKVFMRL